VPGRGIGAGGKLKGVWCLAILCVGSLLVNNLKHNTTCTLGQPAEAAVANLNSCQPLSLRSHSPQTVHNTTNS
jgi:hypothetical protein